MFQPKIQTTSVEGYPLCDCQAYDYTLHDYKKGKCGMCKKEDRFLAWRDRCVACDAKTANSYRGPIKRRCDWEYEDDCDMCRKNSNCVMTLVESDEVKEFSKPYTVRA